MTQEKEASEEKSLRLQEKEASEEKSLRLQEKEVRENVESPRKGNSGKNIFEAQRGHKYDFI